MVFRKILSFLDSRKAQKLQEYRKVLEQAISDGIITPEEETYLSFLREELGLSYENVKQVALEIFREELNKKYTTPVNCDPSYPDVCIPPPPPDLDCSDIPYRNFRVLPPDPHHFDVDGDGIGCET
jgi:hypothetical protein